MLNQKTRIKTGRPGKPSDVARQTLRELADRKLDPTPDNYRRLYVEIDGAQESKSSPSAEGVLQKITSYVPRNTPELTRLGSSLTDAVDTRDWLKVQQCETKYTFSAVF